MVKINVSLAIKTRRARLLRPYAGQIPNSHPGVLTELYLWFHRHFPHFIDCEPIHAVDQFDNAWFTIRDRINMSIWSLLVIAMVAAKAQSADHQSVSKEAIV